MVRSFGMEGLRFLAEQVHKEQQHKDQDYMFLVSGSEGSGKSNIGLWLFEYMMELRGVKYPINLIARDIQELAENTATHPVRSFHWLDEGRELDSVNTMTIKVKAFSEWLTQIRKAGHVIGVCFRNPFRMIKYIQDDKVFAVIHCYSKGEGANKKYYAKVFSKDRFAFLKDDVQDMKTLRKIIESERANYEIKLKYYDGEYRKAYEERKDVGIIRANESFRDRLGGDNKLLHTSKAAILLGVPGGTVNVWIKEKKLIPDMAVPTKDGKFTYRFKKETLLEFKARTAGGEHFGKAKVVLGDSKPMTATHQVQKSVSGNGENNSNNDEILKQNPETGG